MNYYLAMVSECFDSKKHEYKEHKNICVSTNFLRAFKEGKKYASKSSFLKQEYRKENQKYRADGELSIDFETWLVDNEILKVTEIKAV